MRKGSTKKMVIPEGIELQMGRAEAIKQPIETIPAIYINKSNKQVVDILLRICDACYGIQQQLEPWAGIRKDIEELK
jgi:hypothetical protein